LTILVGGEQGVLGDAADVLELAASAIVYLGRPGDGYTAKLLQQYVKYARFLVAAEALTFAQHEAMDLSATLAALQAGTGALPGLGSAEDYFLGDGPAVAARAPVSTITKDLELTRTMFVEAGFRSPSFESLAEFFLAADSEALHDRPYPEVVGLLEAFRYSQEARR
jgi:3-hydroxyisobutyrate dehydrogenase-like beta-hydroxyacid dehydrogenase